jgi:hypothetical protein
MSRSVSRRDFLKLAGGGLIATAGVSLLPPSLRRVLLPELVAEAQVAWPDPDLYYAGTDGWISLPPTPAIGFYHPDNLAPQPPDDVPGLSTYIFGFRNVTHMTPEQKSNQKNHAQHSAPMFWVDEYDESDPARKDFRMQLTNLGLALRPDLFDAHTIHWHGFRNVIPFFDGEPTTSVSVPTGRDFTYIYRPREEGTYMFHCHVEDVEHVHMGMTGMVFVRAYQNKWGGAGGAPISRLYGGPANAPMGYAYNDNKPLGDPASTAYDREYAMFMSEVWAEAHWADAHIQLPDWTDYHADFALLNGRVYPDTIAPNGSIDPFHPVYNADGDMIPTPGYEHLKYQPISSLVECNAGEKVLLRFANLGFVEGAMTLPGIQMRVVGRDATPMVGRDGTDTSYETDTISIGAGESFDVIFTAPQHTGPGYTTYMLYNRAYTRSNNLADGGFGGQATEIHVYAADTLGSQSIPNT